VQVAEEHFRETWVRPDNGFVEAELGSMFFLDRKIMTREEEWMEAFMLNEKREQGKKRDCYVTQSRIGGRSQ
jgi:hypothetical protein